MTVSSWSHSKMGDFERCKKFFWLKHVERVPEPERPLPKGKSEHANDRGTRLHQSCEDYVTGKDAQMVPEVEKHFGPQLDLLRVLHAEGCVSLEGEWGYNRDWEPWDWSGQWIELEAADPDELGMTLKSVRALPAKAETNVLYKKGKKFFFWEPAWLRMKLDAIVFHDKTLATVIDYKSGRKFGNEVKHGEQLQLYQLGAFARYPELETVYAELWYLDHGIVTSQRYTRAQGLRFKRAFTVRGDKVTTCDEYPPNPSIHACRWCQYGPWNGGQCQEGVR